MSTRPVTTPPSPVRRLSPVPVIPPMNSSPPVALSSPPNSLLFRKPLSPNSALPVGNYETTRVEELVEQKLASKGFTPLDRVLLQEADGAFSAKYIQAVTKSGQTTLVELDIEGVVASSPSDMIVSSCEKAPEAVPHSLKLGALDTVGAEVMGVAFYCDDNVCVVSRTNEPTPTEVNYALLDAGSRRHRRSQSTPVSYPVVRLSEVLEHPEAVMKSVEAAASALRTKAYQTSLNELKESQVSMTELRESFDTYFKVQETEAKRLHESIKEINKLLHGYTPALLESEVNQEKFKLLLYNLRKRYELLVDLILTNNSVAQLKREMTGLIEQVRDRSRFLVDEFKLVDRVLEA